jgi:Trk-type K+ transport system membrane component
MWLNWHHIKTKLLQVIFSFQLFIQLLSVVGIVVFIFDFGFEHNDIETDIIFNFYLLLVALGTVAAITRFITNSTLLFTKVIWFDTAYFIAGTMLTYAWLKQDLILFNINLYEHKYIVKGIFVITIIRKLAALKLNYKRTVLNPAQLFVASFLMVILIGAFMLMLPNATYSGINFTNALFTSASAVCVTGLIVVDTGSFFTPLGQNIILFLIQIGGLGILTFASYFSYFFKGGTSYENQLVLSDMTSSKKLGEVFSTLKYIIGITLIIEFIAAAGIYFSLEPTLFQTTADQVYFSIFHAISAFCNAGFSNLSNGLYEEGFRFNYGLQIIIIVTFVLGGLGFPIVSNVVSYIKYKIKSIFFRSKRKQRYKPWVLNINSRITVITTTIITVIGFVLFFVLEYNNTLREHSGIGKWVTALFGATTPRTAGFNTIDTSAMLLPTTLLVLLLMWIGASPMSTGGGIKTSTFAIATLNILSLAKGKSRIEIFRREIADISVRRAFATISLSLAVIGLGIVLITITDPNAGLIKIAFECFSAYSTVGLSLGITADLSTTAKYILVVIMFVGRVSMLSVMIAVINKVKYKNYRYPTEEITIN